MSSWIAAHKACEAQCADASRSNGWNVSVESLTVLESSSRPLQSFLRSLLVTFITIFLVVTILLDDDGLDLLP